MNPTLNHSEILLPRRGGSVLGGILLLSGSCIGVGMLVLPILTGLAGATPTCVVFVLSWLYMSATALLLAEAMQGAPKGCHLVTLVDHSLGKMGKWVVLTTFLLLFYALIIAYIAKGGELVQEGLSSFLQLPWIPSWVGPSVLALGTSLFLYFGTWIVDHFNRICMYVLFISLFYFLSQGIVHSEAANLKHSDWSYSLFIVPFIITSFGFHNMIPTVHEYLEGERGKLTITILLAGLITLGLYLLWTLVMQSILPLQGETSIQASFRAGEIATAPLIRLVNTPLIQASAFSLAFFAIITSLLGQSLSLLDFIFDSFSLPKTGKNRMWLLLLIFIPALTLSLVSQNVFFLGLEFAGGVATMILFGILPTLVVWVRRYRDPERMQPLLPGGRMVLTLIFLLSCTVICYEIMKHLP